MDDADISAVDTKKKYRDYRFPREKKEMDATVRTVGVCIQTVRLFIRL
jgi:hypothetical protein